MSVAWHRLRRAAPAVAGLGFILGISVGSAACAGRGVPTTIEPHVASSAIERTAPERPVQVVFDWTMLDGQARFSGSGVARIQPPYHARLDLFGPRGDGYLSAALVDEEIRLPPGTGSVPLPPPAMMWAALGVVAPPAGATLSGTRTEEGRVEVHYAVDESRVRYILADGRLASATWTGPGRRMAVELRGLAQGGLPSESYFRDWSGNTELRLRLQEVHDVESFPPEIWTPDE